MYFKRTSTLAGVGHKNIFADSTSVRQKSMKFLYADMRKNVKIEKESIETSGRTLNYKNPPA